MLNHQAIAVAAALTGSCAIFYLLYNMKVKSKERRSASRKNKVDNKQPNVNEEKKMEESNINLSLDQSNVLSHMKNNSGSFDESHKESSLCIHDEITSLNNSENITSSDQKIEQNISNSELRTNEPCDQLSCLDSKNILETVTGDINEMCISEEESSLHRPNLNACNNKENSLNMVTCSNSHTSIYNNLSNNTNDIHDDVISPIDNNITSLKDCENLCHMSLEVPEKDIRDLPISSEISNIVSPDNNTDDSNNLSITQAVLENQTTVNLSECNEDCSKVVPTQPQNLELESKSPEKKNVDEIRTRSPNHQVINESVKSLVPVKSKKQRQREKKRAAKAKLNETQLEVAQNSNVQISKSEPNAIQRNLPYKKDKMNKKEGFWSVRGEESLEPECKDLENKILASSPDHISLCTSDLDRETSQTPEHENITSDSQSLISQASFDSGQGSIDQETIFSNIYLPEGNFEYYITYQFEVPQVLVGKLIGKKGLFLNKVKATTSTNIVVLHHSDKKFKLCSIEGKKWQVLKALDLIRDHFPSEQFPELNLTQVNTPSPEYHPEVNRQLLEVELPPGVVLEVQASAVIATGEIWLQQPLHPTFSALQRLHQCLNLNYGDGSSTPIVPDTTPPGTICVCQIGEQWLRCQIVEHDGTQGTVCLLDIGGCFMLPLSLLRQIRIDYFSLPFQATKCYLHGIEPTNEYGWEEEGRLALLNLTKNSIIYATIAAYSEDGIPLVNLYQRQLNQYIFLNEKLVEMGHAKWISMTTQES